MAFKKKVIATEESAENAAIIEEETVEPAVEETAPTQVVEEIVVAKTSKKVAEKDVIIEQIREICDREVKMVGDYKIYRTELHIVVECQKDVLHLYEFVKKLPVDKNIKHANLGTHKSLFITEL